MSIVMLRHLIIGEFIVEEPPCKRRSYGHRGRAV